MADVPVPSIATATPDGDDTVLGVKDGLVKRFTLDNVGAGINFSAINATTDMAFNNAGVERMRLNSAGNLGLGVTPNPWTAGIGTKALQVGGYGAHIFGTGTGWSSNPFIYIGNNAYHYDGAWRYSSSKPSAQYVQSANQHLWYLADAGTAGSPITFNNVMGIYSNGTLIVSGPVQASAFQDVNNTAYYLDPANTGTSLNVAGSIIAAGNVTAYSDIRVKANIEPIHGALDKLSQINGVTYTRTDLDDKERRYGGVIAQEIEAVLPEAVFDDGVKKAVDYNATIGLLIQAVKEQQAQIEELKLALSQIKGN